MELPKHVVRAADRAATGVLLLKEKHGDCYLDASTKEKLFKVCKGIVERRTEEGWYETEPGKQPIAPEAPPENSPAYVKTAYETELKNYKRELSDYNQTVEEIAEHTMALADESGKAAYFFLSQRSAAQYENFKIIHVSESY